MYMQTHMSLLSHIFTLGVLATSKFGYGSIVEGRWNTSCIKSELQSLLLLKKSLVDNSNYLSSWVGDDCCAWHGIGCNNKTGHVIQLDLRNGFLKGAQIYPSLLDLKYLTYLDLSFNRLDESHIPEFFGSFKYLTYLDLSYSYFRGLVPHHLGNLSNLQYLDLSYNDMSSIDSMGWLSKLPLLEHLDLSYVNLSTADDWFQAINMLPNSLSVLKLFRCKLPNNVPLDFPSINLTSLISLDLGDNRLKGSFPSWVFNNSGLSLLNLANNNLNGSIPRSMGSLTHLSVLDLSSNNFHGSISHEMVNLTKLSSLSISSNELRGFVGETICQLSKLELLDIGSNQFSGSIPKCIGELSNLQFLGLEYNSWEGFVSEHHFVNLTRLTDLFISSKSDLSLNISSKWVPPFQLHTIYMNDMKIGPKFPQWLLTQRQIWHFMMSNVRISDTIPVDWFVTLLSEASEIDLSNNDINGEQLSLISSDPTDLDELKLSNNRLSGELPAFLCNLTSLRFLYLSNNNFSGVLPLCLGNLTRLMDFDVMNNSLSGSIPVSLGYLGNLAYLNLHDTKFQGELPSSFQNLTKLVVLDVGKNRLSDNLPRWSGGQLPFLKYLILRSNNFYGKIPTQLCHLSSIQVLSLAQNQITGNIPHCFGNFTAIITSDRSDPYARFPARNGETIIYDAKGYEQTYTSTLKFLFSIDLSTNYISGKIPEELMDLHGLSNLNLAGNRLAGRIPDRIGKLDKLESLDLSRNELYGPIPQSLSDLNFLSHLNLSFNDLSGRIPTGNQLQTLNEPSIYEGNNQLCGRPVLKPCVGDTDSHNVPDNIGTHSDSDSDDERKWLYAGIGPGILVGFLGFYSALYFINSWREFIKW